MLLNYVPVLVYMIICIGLIGVMLLLSESIRPCPAPPTP